MELHSTPSIQKVRPAIDPQGLLKSAVLGWASGAKIRIGFDASQAREKAWWFYTKRFRPDLAT